MTLSSRGRIFKTAHHDQCLIESSFSLRSQLKTKDADKRRVTWREPSTCTTLQEVMCRYKITDSLVLKDTSTSRKLQYGNGTICTPQWGKGQLKNKNILRHHGKFWMMTKRSKLKRGWGTWKHRRAMIFSTWLWMATLPTQKRLHNTIPDNRRYLNFIYNNNAAIYITNNY